MNEKLEKNFSVKVIDIEEDDLPKTIETWGAFLQGYQSVKIENEIEKTEREVKLINLAIEKVKSFVSAQFDVDPLDITTEMIHLLPELVYKKYDKKYDKISLGLYSKIGILVNNDEKLKKDNDLELLMLLVHEILHSASFNKLFCKMNQKDGQIYNELLSHRVGLDIVTGKKYKEKSGRQVFFEGISEATTEYLTNSIYSIKIKGMPEFAEEVSDLKGMTPEVCRGYSCLVELFRDLYEKIYKVNNDKFEDEFEVRNLIMKAYFDGNVREFAQLTKSLGAGAYKDLALITGKEDKDNFEAIKAFRKKYGLPEDEYLAEVIKKMEKDYK